MRLHLADERAGFLSGTLGVPAHNPGSA